MRMPIFFALIALVVAPVKAQEAGVHFESGMSWQQVLEKAKVDNKGIFVDCYATWCAPCKQMDKDTYPDPGVGAYLNEHFVSVKMQMDTTPQDSDFVKSWRHDAQLLAQRYEIHAYPTLLFFAPSGEILHKGMGARSPKALLLLSQDAADPEKQYYSRLSRYRTSRDYSVMPKLAYDIADLDGKDAAKSIARDYIDQHLAKIADSELLTKENLLFLRTFLSSCWEAPALQSSERIFQVLRQQAENPHARMQKPARSYVDAVISHEEIVSKIYVGTGRDKKPIAESPDWASMNTKIEAKYGASYAGRLIPEAEVDWYWDVEKDYNRAARAYFDYISQDGVVDVREAAVPINQVLWQLVFEHCSEPKILEQAISWQKRVVDAADTSIDEILGRCNLADTLANLLYKAGQKEAAIACEQKLIQEEANALPLISAKYKRQLNPNRSWQRNLELMQKGLPTWGLTKGS